LSPHAGIGYSSAARAVRRFSPRRNQEKKTAERLRQLLDKLKKE
jgi:hypothetical protein